MKVFVYILSLSLTFSACQKSDNNLSDAYSGQWNFDVKYQSVNNFAQTNYKFEGEVVSLRNQLIFYYGLSDDISAKVNSKGVLHNSKGQLIGVIEKETCLLDFNQGDYHIKIKGFKNL